MSRTQNGYSVLEVLLAGAVFALAASGIMAAIIFARESTQTSNLRQDARALAEEGLTAVKTIRDREWGALTEKKGQALSFDESTSQWSLIQNPSSDQDTKGRLTRRVDITSGDLPDTKNVTVRVEYPINRTDTQEIALESLVAKLSDQRYGGDGSTSQNYQLVNQTLGNINQERTRPSLLLDEYSGAAVAYSVRRIREGYTGPALTIRKGANDELEDIEFAGDELDTAEISRFCESSDCYVQTWHDQSGNGNDASRGTNSEQPKIYDGGTQSVVTDNGRPALDFDGSDDRLNLSNSFAFLDSTSFVVLNRDTTSAFHILNSISKNKQYRINADNINYAAANNKWNGGSTGAFILDGGYNNNQVLLSLQAFQKLTLYKNGTQTRQSSTRVDDDSVPMGLIGARPAGGKYADGTFQEMVLYESDQSANRSGIEANINEYYGIY